MVKKLWKDPVWSAVIAAGIVAAATYLLGYWPHIWRALTQIPSWLSVGVTLPLWAVILLVPALLLAIPLVSSLHSSKKPGFLSYTRDTIFEINWSWRWLPPGFYTSQYTMHDLVARCPSCTAVLEFNDYSRPLVRCVNESCSWQWERQRRSGSRIGSSSELESRVRNEVDRRIHAGERG
jgi:hypothetical protein